MSIYDEEPDTVERSLQRIATALERIADQQDVEPEPSPVDAELRRENIELRFSLCRKAGHVWKTPTQFELSEILTRAGAYTDTCERCGVQRAWGIIGGAAVITGYTYPEGSIPA